MIQTQNSFTRPISRLESIMSDLINESEESLSCRPLTNPYIPYSTDWTLESCHFGNPNSISEHTSNLTKLQVLKVTWTFWQVIPSLKLKSNLNVILNLSLIHI